MCEIPLMWKGALCWEEVICVSSKLCFSVANVCLCVGHSMVASMSAASDLCPSVYSSLSLGCELTQHGSEEGDMSNKYLFFSKLLTRRERKAQKHVSTYKHVSAATSWR